MRAPAPVLNAVASYTIIRSSVRGIGIPQRFAGHPGAGGSTTKAKYTGFAGYVTYMFTPKFRGVVRAESFDDKDGVHFGTAGTKYKEVTLTGAFLASDSFEARVEGRRDNATNTMFTDFAGAASKTHDVPGAAGASTKF